MADIYSITPVDQRPYEWARTEMETMFPKPHKYWITYLEELDRHPEAEVAIFHSKYGPDIWRVYWRKEDKVKYDILRNYEMLKNIHPDIVERLEENGRKAYRERESMARKYGKRSKRYSAFMPYRKTN